MDVNLHISETITTSNWGSLIQTVVVNKFTNEFHELFQVGVTDLPKNCQLMYEIDQQARCRGKTSQTGEVAHR